MREKSKPAGPAPITAVVSKGRVTVCVMAHDKGSDGTCLGAAAPYDQNMSPDDLRTLRELLRQQRLLSLGVVVDSLPVVGLLPFLAAPNFAGLVVHASQLAPHTAGLGSDQPRHLAEAAIQD